MDSGRFLLAVVLMIAVMVVTNLLLPPPQPPLPEIAPDSVARTGIDAGRSPADSLLPAQDVTRTSVADTGAATAAITAAGGAAGDTLVVSSPLFEYRIATRGGAVLGARLLEFASQTSDSATAVELAVPAVPLFSYGLRIGTREVALGSLPFTVRPDTSFNAGAAGAPQTLELLHDGADFDVAIRYAFDPADYVIGVRIAVSGTGDQVPVLHLRLPGTLAMNEAKTNEDERLLAYVFNNEREGIGSVRLETIDEERVSNGPLHWVAVKNKYFVAAALTDPTLDSRFGGVVARPVPEEFAADLTATLVPAADRSFSFRLYIGPQEPARLARLGNGFSDVNPFGWRPFRPILRPLGHAIQWALFGMHDLLGIGYGWVLVLFGVLIRLLLWPLNARAMRSQMKNMEIQPKLKEIQAKYKAEPEKLQKEMLRLYKEEGFNPMGGCLPMLVPLPILITLFFVFQATIAFRGVEFLWLPDLSRADPLYILPVLLGVSMFLMQWLSGRSMTEINPQMKFMMYAMPLFMTVIFLNFASGLNLYYAAMNFASLPQQVQIMRERQRFQATRPDSGRSTPISK
ncbi:MAG: membrane protein insertase YidC [Gemmatimonadota bacterium]